MHDGVNFVLGENVFDLRADPEIDVTEVGCGRDRGAMAFLEVIESNDLHAAREQDLRTDASDVAGGSGNQDIQ
jgi:hypothetical protein